MAKEWSCGAAWFAEKIFQTKATARDMSRPCTLKHPHTPVIFVEMFLRIKTVTRTI